MKNYKLYPFLGLLFIFVIDFSLIISTHFSWNNAMNKYLPLQKEIKLVKSNLSQAHLWLEESIAGDLNIDIEKDVMIPLSNQSLFNYLKIAKDSLANDKKYLKQLVVLEKQLKAFHEVAKKRWSKTQKYRIGSDLDQDFDKKFKTILNLLDSMSADISTKITVEIENRNTYFTYIIILFLLMNVLILLILFSSKRKQEKSENKLLEQQQFANNIIDSVDNLIFVKDINSVYIACNKAYEKFLGIDKKEIIGKNDHDLHDKELALSLIKHDKEMIAKQKAQTDFEWASGANGKKYYLLTSKAPLKDIDGNLIGVVGNSADFTEQNHLYEFFQKAQAQAKLGSWEQTLNTEKLFWSNEVYNIFELDSKTTMSFEKFIEYVHPDDRSKVSTSFQSSLKEHTPYYLEHRLLFSDGRIKYVIERAEHFYDNNNKYIRTIGTIQDITEKLLAENEIKKRDTILTSVFQVIPDLLFIMDKKGLIIDYRAQKDSFLYIKPKQFLGKYMPDILPKNIGELFRKNIAKLPKNYALNIFKYELEIKGEIHHYEARMAQLPVNNHIMTIVRDVSKQVSHEQKLIIQTQLLEHKKLELETIIQESPSPMILHEEGGKIIMLNQAWIYSSGFSLEETPTINDWIKNAYTEESEIYMKEHINSLYIITEKVNKGEFSFLNKNKDLITWQISSSPLGLIDGKRTIITSAMDITELKHKDEMLINQSRNAAMGEMIGMIAHQWRQPLSAISMEANNILLDSAMDNLNMSVLVEYANNISEHTKHLSQTIDDFRNFFKPDKVASKVNIKDILDQTLSIVKNSLLNHNIELKSSFETDKEVNAYPRELMQVFVNIITNSKDALTSNKPDGAQINIKVYEDEKYINTKISDNGGGIDKNILAKIFDPYFSTKNEKTGTGLGLYMSKMIIEEHLNGVLKVKNNEDGACFTVSLLKDVML